MNLEDNIENCINEKPGLFRRSINFLGRKVLPYALTASIGITSTLGLYGCSKSKKDQFPFIPRKPVPTIPTEFVDIDESKITQDPDNGLYQVKDQLLIGFNTGVTDAEKKEIINNVNGNIVAIDNDLGIYQVNVSVTDLNDLYARANTLENDLRVEFASPNYALKETKIPDPGKDPIFNIGGGQWDEINPAGLNWAWEYIKAPSAWDYTTGSSNTNIGIIDFGFDKNHDDLKNNIVHTEPFWGLNPNNPHGTEVTGIIGAEGNNDYGITGMNWDVSLHLYKTPFKEETGIFDKIFDTSIMKYLKKIANSNIKVINFSGAVDWGLEDYNPLDPNLPSDLNPEHIEWLENRTQVYREMFNILKENNVLVIQSAGNDGIDAKWSGLITPTLAAEFPDNYILVAANNDAGNIPGFSNYGNLITVSAPGVDITSCTNEEKGWYRSSLAGTSFSAPFVTGLAGLLLSINQNLTPAQIKQAIVDGAIAGEKYFTDPDLNDIYIINSLESILNIMNISKTSSGNSGLPKIAVDFNNNLHVVWMDYNPSNWEIFYSKYNGSNWSSPENISNTTGRSNYPDIAIDSNNNLHVVWFDEITSGGINEILYSKYDGSNWSTPANISNNPIEGSRQSTIAVDSNNNIHVVWHEAGSPPKILYSKYNGVSWSSPLDIDPLDGGGVRSDIAVDFNNNLHVIWEAMPTVAGLEILYTKYNGSSWSVPTSIVTGNGLTTDYQRIVVDSNNNLHVAYHNHESPSTSDGEVYYLKYNGSSWSVPTNISNNTGMSRDAEIAIDSNNNPHIVWYDDTEGNYEIYYSKYNGSNWSSPINVSNTTSHSDNASITIDSNNKAYIVWSDDILGNSEIFYKKK